MLPGCPTARGQECLFWWLWSWGTWWSVSLTPWEGKSLCPCSQGASASTGLHFLRRSVMLMDILHREWAQQSPAWGKTPCSSTFRLKQAFGQEWTSKLTHWFLLLFPRVQTSLSFNTSAVFYFLAVWRAVISPGGKPFLLLFWHLAAGPDKMYNFHLVHSDSSQEQSLQPI